MLLNELIFLFHFFFFLLEVLEKPPCLPAQYLSSILILSVFTFSIPECLHFSMFCKAVFFFPSTADPCQFVDHFTNSCIFYWRFAPSSFLNLISLLCPFFTLFVSVCPSLLPSAFSFCASHNIPVFSTVLAHVRYRQLPQCP